MLKYVLFLFLFDYDDKSNVEASISTGRRTDEGDCKILRRKAGPIRG